MGTCGQSSTSPGVAATPANHRFAPRHLLHAWRDLRCLEPTRASLRDPNVTEIHPVAAVAPPRFVLCSPSPDACVSRPSPLSSRLAAACSSSCPIWMPSCPALPCPSPAQPCPALPWLCLGPPSASARRPVCTPDRPLAAAAAVPLWTGELLLASPGRRRRRRRRHHCHPLLTSSPSPTHPFAVVGTLSGPYSPPSDVADTDRHSTSTSTPVRGFNIDSSVSTRTPRLARSLSTPSGCPSPYNIDLVIVAIHPRLLRTGPAPPPFLELGR